MSGSKLLGSLLSVYLVIVFDLAFIAGGVYLYSIFNHAIGSVESLAVFMFLGVACIITFEARKQHLHARLFKVDERRARLYVRRDFWTWRMIE